MRPICLLGWLLLALPFVSVAGNDPYLLTLGSSLPSSKVPAGYIPLNIDEDAAIHAAVSKAGVWIPLPDGSRVHLDYSNKVEHSDGTWTFIGSSSGAFGAPKSLITFGDHAVFGTVYTASGKPFVLTTWHGRNWLVDHRGMPESAAMAHPRALDEISAPDRLVANVSAQPEATMPQKEATASNPATVDLLVVYTTDFRTSFGSTSAAVARADYLVDMANQVLQDSQVYGRIRLVHTAEVPYTGDPKYALDDLSGINRSIPASLSSVAPMRAQYGADAVTMMQMYEPSTAMCGSYWALGQNLTPITSSDADKAFSVLEEDAALDCDLDGYGLVETLGESFGLVPALTDNAGTGAYSFSYAYIGTLPNTGGAQVCTLLAEDLSSTMGCDHVPYFSNPNIDLCGGPCGIPDQSDAARSLNLTLPIIAAFERTTLVHDDDDGDGKSDLFWYSSSLHEMTYWLMNGAQMNSWKELGVPAGYQPAGVGDFNGDKLADILWTDSSHHLYMWVNDGAGGFTNHLVVTYQAYCVAGVGDMDGDGKSDIIWFNQSTGGVTYWLMNGWTVKSWRGFSVKPINHLAGVGDFNGDGLADLLWAQDSTRKVYEWIGNSTGGFTGILLNTYQPGWGVAGAGDADGDGKSDIYWYNQGTGQFTYWLMDGFSRISWRGFTMDKSYRPVTIADYNGSGRADILWTNDARDLLMSVDDGAGGFNPQHVTQYSTNYVPFGN